MTDLAPRQFLTVVEPTASISPRTQQLAAGETAVFTLATMLPSPLIYQWRLDGVEVPGETNLTIVIPNVQRARAGNYSVTVINPDTGLAFTTPPASLTGPAVIKQQPQSQQIRLGSNVTFRVAATGLGPLSYQWHWNGIALPDATNDTYGITNVQVLHEGAYTAAVSNCYGNILSTPAHLVVLIKPVVTVQPLSQSVAAGGSVTFSVVAEGNPSPFGFRWRKGGTTLTNIVVESTACFFTVTNIQPSGTNNIFTYSVTVTNLAGSVLSRNAVLTVLADADGDGLPDEWESAHGLNAADVADAALDPDGDGLTNLQEYLSDTDPQETGSRLRIEAIDRSAGGYVSLRFTAVSNKTYSVQWRPSLSGAQWNPVAEVPASPATRIMLINDDTSQGTAEQRFYRLITPRTR